MSQPAFELVNGPTDDYNQTPYFGSPESGTSMKDARDIQFVLLGDFETDKRLSKYQFRIPPVLADFIEKLTPTQKVLLNDFLILSIARFVHFITCLKSKRDTVFNLYDYITTRKDK